MRVKPEPHRKPTDVEELRDIVYILRRAVVTKQSLSNKRDICAIDNRNLGVGLSKLVEALLSHCLVPEMIGMCLQKIMLALLSVGLLSFNHFLVSSNTI